MRPGVVPLAWFELFARGKGRSQMWYEPVSKVRMRPGVAPLAWFE